MHQFMLFGNVPLERHNQVMSIIAGVSATQPTPYAEQHALFEPQHTAAVTDSNVIGTKRKPQLNANQQRYVNDVNRDMDYETYAPTTNWKLTIKEEPEAGSPNLISQPYTSFDTVDWQKYLNPVGFKYGNSQVWRGHYFVHGNVVLKVFRVLLPKTEIQQPLGNMPPKKEELEYLDPSGAYIIEACVRVEDRKDSSLTDVATKELLDVQKLLQGSVPLIAPDRLALDTRVRGD
ncbi:hypothetical protein AMS68_002452 [Peltaster fructicola]|uniref:Mediator of RNA polymerase II transcription subunit 18 n=1 Tax=Peltaster fructicola TaxID=286661 RepID=A0A6H0XQM5_9PEZI|nr:hypothetical protein AMS68_002452 [Peltaster fructicola]